MYKEVATLLTGHRFSRIPSRRSDFRVCMGSTHHTDIGGTFMRERPAFYLA